jgi:hypothetical protein
VRKIFALMLLILLTGVLAFAAGVPLPAAWQNWRFSRALILPEAPEPKLMSVTVPREVYASAQIRLEDLRVVDDQGREVPYVLYARHGGTVVETCPTALVENRFFNGRYTEVMLDLGEHPTVHNGVALTTLNVTNGTLIEIAGSNDNREWGKLAVRPGTGRAEPEYTFHLEAVSGGLHNLEYAETQTRYVRLRFLDSIRQFPVTIAEAFYEFVEEPERARVPVAFTPDENAGPKRSIWYADLGSALQPIDEIRFEAAQPEFHRKVRIITSDNDKDWDDGPTGEILRKRQGDTNEAQLRVSFSEEWGRRYWGVMVLNGNDPPLAGAQPALMTTPRHIVFRQEPGRRYRLLYGHDWAKPPEYDLAQLAGKKAVDSAPAGKIGLEEENSAYVDPRPWSDRHPLVLWVALGIAVVVLGDSSLRALGDSAGAVENRETPQNSTAS